MPADAQLVGHLPDAAEVDCETGPGGVEYAVGEISAGGHAQHRERRPDGQTRRYAKRVGHELGREIGPLAQLEMARDIRDADPEFQLGRDLIAERRLDKDRPHVRVIAEEPAREVVGVPLRFESVRRV